VYVSPGSCILDDHRSILLLVPSARLEPAVATGAARIASLRIAHAVMRHRERHRTHRTGWLRAAVLGANDGIVSNASLALGVAAAGASTQAIFVAGVAGLVAGAMSMAAGEYVSVSSQADTERADLARESRELAANPEQEHAELASIYVKRGLDHPTATAVASQLMQHDALGAHGRDELGISDTLAAKPLQAALASAGTFAVGAILPLLIVLLTPPRTLMAAVAASALVFLAVLGFLAARAGGAPVLVSVARVVFWGATAMALTAGVGALFGDAA
jgi:VIT1/CCC1 family predicted Fe2+/Mn2+ transporter